MPDKKYPLILRAMSESPWAVTLDKWMQIREIIDFRSRGGKLTHEEIRERIGVKKSDVPQFFETSGFQAANRPSKATAGKVAVLPMFGLISPRLSEMDESSGGLSLERFSKVFREQVNDPGVKAIILNIDSPGGNAAGVAEFADEVFAARKEKHIVAIANHMAASAAFWIASSADDLVVSTSGEVGSIGVFMAHTEISELEKMMGVKTTLISSGKFKTEGNPFEPLTPEALEHFQGIADNVFGMFVSAVARGRGVSAAKVKRDFGEGRMALAEDAVTRGMADRVATLDKVLFDLGAQGERKGMRAEVNPEGDSMTITGDGSGDSLPEISESDLRFLEGVPLVETEEENTENLDADSEDRDRRIRIMELETTISP